MCGLGYVCFTDSLCGLGVEFGGFCTYGVERSLFGSGHDRSLLAREKGFIIASVGDMARAATDTDSAAGSRNRIIIIIITVVW